MSSQGGGSRDRSERGIEARFVRQGRRGTRMIWVMTTSLALVALLMLALWAVQLGPNAGQAGRLVRADARARAAQVPAGQPAAVRPAPGGGRTE